nr:hypothetical protein [Pandoraea apista]
MEAARIERCQIDAAQARCVMPGQLELGAGADDQQTAGRRILGHEREQFLRRRIGPVSVIEHEYAAIGQQRGEQRRRFVEHGLLPRVRHIAVGVHVEQRAQTPMSEQGGLRELRGVGGGLRAQPAGDRMERRARAVLCTGQIDRTQSACLNEVTHERRLANTGLADHQRKHALSGAGVAHGRVSAGQFGQYRIAAEEHSCAAARPALRRRVGIDAEYRDISIRMALAHRAVRRGRDGNADEALRGVADDDFAGERHVGQLCGGS